jgi:predicted enzyme related to lactoylglutathione lyase
MKNESYICHIVFPSKDHHTSGRFYRQVFDWDVKPQSGTSSLDILPPSHKGISAELNLKEKTVVPSIFTSNMETVLERIQHFGGKILKDKTPIGEQAEHGYFALFEDPSGNKMCLYSER